MQDELELEQHRELITDGAFADALDLVRRLLRVESSAQRAEAAHLVLDRLRNNKRDSDDDVNALLRLVANYVVPTRELTEDALSLLFFCDHRVLVIHHLSKLTYQSQECVKLVVEAYLELLASDRSLLVPILGSLADLPLDAADKSAVLDATECLLDAAVEADVPAVVQSLLSMVTVATAPRIAAKLRAECNRIDSGTLCLTLEVIGRFAVVGSSTLTALLRVVRLADALTTFDVILLTHLMGKSTENEIAIKTSSYLAHRGQFQRGVLLETLAQLVQPEWRALLPAFVRFCSFLLAVCFQDLTKTTLALRYIPVAVDCLGSLVAAKTAVHEEALTLLFTLSSQPRKLLLLATSATAQHTRGVLCWKIAEAAARRLAALAHADSKVLAPYAHLFLDHLHSIASATSDASSGVTASIGSYPAHILDTLCGTMVALTAQERGVFSLLMITIQKQLVSRASIASSAHAQLHLRSGGSGAATRPVGATQVKQLMALFLAGHLLKSPIALDERDRKSLVSWILRLLSTASSDETLLHAMRLVQDGMTDAAAPFMKSVASEEERSLCASLMAQVFRKKSLVMRARDDVVATANVVVYDRPLTEPLCPAADALEPSLAPLVADLIEFARKMQLDVAAAHKRTSPGDRDAVAARDAGLDRAYAAKLQLLQQLYHSFVAFSQTRRQDDVLDCAFVLPALHQTLLSSSQTSRPLKLEPQALNDVIWALVCALVVAVMSANEVAARISQGATALSVRCSDAAALHQRLVARLQLCLDLHDQLERALGAQKDLLQARVDEAKSTDTADGTAEIEWLSCQCSAAERLVTGMSARRAEEPLSASLRGIELHTLCRFFYALVHSNTRMALPLAHELALLRVVSAHLHSDTGERPSAWRPGARAPAPGDHDDAESASASETKRVLLLTTEGRQMLMYLSARASELGQVVNAAPASASEAMDSEDDNNDSSSEDGDADNEADVSDGSRDDREGAAPQASSSDATTQSMQSLLCIYSLFVQVLESCDDSDAPSSDVQSGAAIALFAAGASGREPSVDASDGARGHVETFYKFLLQETLKTKNAQLACALIDILVVLTARTRKQHTISRLCMLMLQHPFPSELRAPVSATTHKRALGEDLPIHTLPRSVVALRCATHCSLAKYRCASHKWRHLAFLVVGSWAFASNAANRTAVMAFYLDAMKALVASVAPLAEDKRRGDADVVANSVVSDASTSDEDKRLVDPAVVVDGEHLVLASLTITTFPFVVDAVVMCAVASLASAAPRASRSTASERETGPFDDICDALAVAHNVLMLYVDAERAGFDLPVKTNLVLLQGASHVLKTVRFVLERCIAWRAEESSDAAWGAVRHLEKLFQTAHSVLHAMNCVLASFQERVALKMQQNGRLLAPAKRPPGGRRAKSRWTSALLAKVYGKKLRKRRWISKAESKLLPYFAHRIEELRDFVEHQSDVNNLELAAADTERTWLSLSPTVDTDFFLRSGAAIQDELIHGSLSDWDRDLSWSWNEGADDDDDDVDTLDDDDAASDDDDDDLMDKDRPRDDARPAPAPAVTHTPPVRRKVRPDASASAPRAADISNARPAAYEIKRQRRMDE